MQDAAQRRCGEGGEDDAEIAGTARGVATAARHQSAHTLERLIGTGRAALLRALERPATSSELAVKLRQSLSTIGGHLALRCWSCRPGPYRAAVDAAHGRSRATSARGTLLQRTWGTPQGHPGQADAAPAYYGTRAKRPLDATVP
ncbi:hypothetical protein RM550_05240 [Streptomyces sp. DSM 41527]|uniref:ArsR family transcriptional regulator n=1 Tax=Streptomyces mooreae TaxID=3075523 RepID=A0ABU2T4I9_9ACTN|nr:hypothetical protein [Streptomyces sp. DSM 41527]MDT0455144.1 hypothetical protein [Streptomyces sp. DSM 41527]